MILSKYPQGYSGRQRTDRATYMVWAEWRAVLSAKLGPTTWPNKRIALKGYQNNSKMITLSIISTPILWDILSYHFDKKLRGTTFYDLSIRRILPALSGPYIASQSIIYFCVCFAAVLRGCAVYHCFAWYFIVRDLVKRVQCGTQRTVKHRVARGRARIAQCRTIANQNSD